MNKREVMEQLYPLSEFVSDPNTGHVMKSEAWEHIDFLLDELIEIDRIYDGTTETPAI